jgi:hypothetical protein
MKFKVTVCQEVWNYYDVEVEADTEDKAILLAVQEFRAQGPSAFVLVSEEPQLLDVVSVT